MKAISTNSLRVKSLQKTQEHLQGIAITLPAYKIYLRNKLLQGCPDSLYS